MKVKLDQVITDLKGNPFLGEMETGNDGKPLLNEVGQPKFEVLTLREMLVRAFAAPVPVVKGQRNTVKETEMVARFQFAVELTEAKDEINMTPKQIVRAMTLVTEISPSPIVVGRISAMLGATAERDEK